MHESEYFGLMFLALPLFFPYLYTIHDKEKF